MPTVNRVIAIGASAGGVEALTNLFNHLPADFSGALFVVLHTSASDQSRLAPILSRAGPLPAVQVDTQHEIHPGNAYVSKPGRHLLVENGQIRSVAGTRVNNHRPSINVLFESVAETYGSNAIGVVLSGALDDGTLGLQVIKAAGGLAIVQSPDEAAFTGMPQSAIEHVDVDYILTAAEIAQVLTEIVQREGNERDEESVPPTARYGVNSMRDAEGIASDVAGFVCPDCGGVLRPEETGHLVHFRCHVGHVFTDRALLDAQGESLESALWMALRILEERISLSRQISQRAVARGNTTVAERLESQVQDIAEKAESIRRVLLGDDSNLSIASLRAGDLR